MCNPCAHGGVSANHLALGVRGFFSLKKKLFQKKRGIVGNLAQKSKNAFACGGCG